MSKFSLWLHRAGARMSAGLRSFMSGRYGSDRLNMAILCAGLIASIFSSLFRDLTVRMIFLVLSYALMFWAIYRALSRNTYKRRSSSERPEFNHIPGTAAGSRIFVFCGKFSVLSSYAHLSFLGVQYFQEFSYFRVFAFFLQKNIPFSENFCLHFLNRMVYCFQFAFKGRTGVLKHS